jgi:hypothetical protein
VASCKWINTDGGFGIMKMDSWRMEIGKINSTSSRDGRKFSYGSGKIFIFIVENRRVGGFVSFGLL